MAGFVTPVMVLLGWAMGKDMGLDFHPFAFCVLLISVLVVAAVMKDGRTSWLQGALLMSVRSNSQPCSTCLRPASVNAEPTGFLRFSSAEDTAFALRFHCLCG